MRGFILAVCVFAAVINAAMLYRPSPVVASPVKVASWIKTDKVQDRLPVKPVPTVTYRMAAVTATPERGIPWSCETIRKAVAGLTSEQIEQVAKMYRLSKWQRAEARRCLKERT